MVMVVQVVRGVQGVQMVQVVQVTQVVNVVNLDQVVRVARVVRVVPPSDKVCQILWFTWSKQSDYKGNSRCHACDTRTDLHRKEM